MCLFFPLFFPIRPGCGSVVRVTLTTKRGRKPKAYVATWGEVIPGLAKDADGRWRIVATRQRFSEADEHIAVARFRQWERANTPERPAAWVPIARSVDLFENAEEGDKITATNSLLYVEHDDGELETGYHVDEAALWRYVRARLLADPVKAARLTGIPQLANLKSFDLPGEPVMVEDVRAAYRAHSTATDRAKQQALAPFNDLVHFAGATTLDDLTEKNIAAFREWAVNHSAMKSSGTIAGYFTRLRGVLRLAGRGELDAAQVERVIARCKAKLYPPANNTTDDPRPISRDDFHKLLAGAERSKVAAVWRAMLLMALNGALYMEDACALEWSMLDLERRTFVSRRRKTGRCLRVATLWPETVAALKALPRGSSPYVFVSPTGTRYSRNSKINEFGKLRERSGVDASVTWSHIRDGAYSIAATAPNVDEKFARLLAGHKSHGLQDKYVLRNPAIVRPACDAVREHYLTVPAQE